MRTVIVVAVCVVITICQASPIKEHATPARQYYPEEDDPMHTKFLSFIDENGVSYYEDLTIDDPEPSEASRAKPKDVTLFLYTQKNKQEGVRYMVGEASQLLMSEFFDKEKPIYFIIHGWTNDFKSDVNMLLKNAILAKSDMNVFVVDWSGQAKGLYSRSKKAVPQIGQFLANFVNNMMDIFQISPSNIKMAGHSLGAHVAGCAGAQIRGKIDYIVGLDPASPLFTVKNTDNRLDPSDADHVQIIHTSTKLLGFKSSIGHVDFFPNKGTSQPGCGMNVLYICSHSRSYEFFEESILLGGFTAKQCINYKNYKAGRCQDNHETYLGRLEIDKSASGDYYLDTNPKRPFSKQ